MKFLKKLLNRIQEDGSYRSGFLVGMMALLFVQIIAVLIFILPKWISSEDLEELVHNGVLAGAFSDDGGCNSACQEKIRASRKKILGIEENELRYVLKEYNAYVRSGKAKKGAKKCLRFKEEFELISKLTLYPEAFIGGLAFFESDACRNPNVRTFDGGYGLAQVTHPMSAHIRDAEMLLGVPKGELSWKRDENGVVNTRHNLALGIVMFDDCEQTFRSRGVAMLCYNRGKGGTRKDLKRAGLDPKGAFQISDFRGAIPTRIGKAKPRTYPDKFIASILIYERARRGLPLKELTSLSLEDLPGAFPSKD